MCIVVAHRRIRSRSTQLLALDVPVAVCMRDAAGLQRLSLLRALTASLRRTVGQDRAADAIAEYLARRPAVSCGEQPKSGCARVAHS